MTTPHQSSTSETRANLLVLTDHRGHSEENSLYALMRSWHKSRYVDRIDVASRASQANADFFAGRHMDKIHTIPVTGDFNYHEAREAFENPTDTVDIASYRYVWLRLPGPYLPEFLEILEEVFAEAVVFNSPRGIWETGSKGFLMTFEDICPPIRLCQSIEDIQAAAAEFPIVLKPFREYGGQGLIRIDGDQVWLQAQKTDWSHLRQILQGEKLEYLAMKFMKNVHLGDKRIVVVNGQVIGASLRLPSQDSWLCNISQGGTSNASQLEPEEEDIVRRVDPILREKGIVMYGLDTLVNDEGKRVLSEINTTSIGGLPQIERQDGRPVVDQTIEQLWSYLQSKENI